MAVKAIGSLAGYLFCSLYSEFLTSFTYSRLRGNMLDFEWNPSIYVYGRRKACLPYSVVRCR